MIDIAFYMRIHELKQRIMAGEPMEREEVRAMLEAEQSRAPVVFNIETTNACNMTCSFCPRTTQMTRPVKTMGMDLFKNIARQLEPHSEPLWREWVEFAADHYKVIPGEQSEDAFFLYCLPRVLVLHGYGDPMLDPHIPARVEMLSRLEIPSYFSCNPANINLERTARAFASGLSYIKYSIDSLSASVRGKDAFANDHPAIMRVLEMKAQRNFNTQIIITMIDLGRDEFAALKEAFAGTDVYIYQKSLDQAWLTGGERPGSIHWSEFCQIPWSSMTIKSDGLAASCEEDFNNEIILGDAKTTPLEVIWNGQDYALLRRAHFAVTPGLHCTERCDMRVIGKML